MSEAYADTPQGRNQVAPATAADLQRIAAAARTAALAGRSFLSGEFAKGTAPGQHAGLDIRAESLIIEELQRAVGSCAVLSEEAGWVTVGTGGPPVFLVDPLDGSNNFFHGVPYWAVVIAASPQPVEGGSVSDMDYGIVACCDGTVIEAQRGKGIRVDGMPFVPASPEIDGQLPPLRRAMTRADKRSTWLLSRKFGSARLFGAAAIEMAWVALGRLDAFFDTVSLKLTDVGGPSVILREAGYPMTDLKGEPIGQYGYDRPKAAGVIATRHPRWQQEAIEAFREVEPEMANLPPGR